MAHEHAMPPRNTLPYTLAYTAVAGLAAVRIQATLIHTMISRVISERLFCVVRGTSTGTVVRWSHR